MARLGARFSPFAIRRICGKRSTKANGYGLAVEETQVACVPHTIGTIDELEKVLRRVDGDPSPPDWLVDGPEKDELRAEIELLIGLLQLEL